MGTQRAQRKVCIQRLEWFVWARSQGPCGVLQEEAGRGQAAAESTSERRRHRRGAGVAPRQQQRRGAAPAAARSWGVCRRRRRQPRRRWRRLGRRRPAAVATAARVGLPVPMGAAASRVPPLLLVFILRTLRQTNSEYKILPCARDVRAPRPDILVAATSPSALGAPRRPRAFSPGVTQHTARV